MANLYSGNHTFSGYKSLAELTELTFVDGNTYNIQVVVNEPYFVREGEEGDGFQNFDPEFKPFTWKFENNDDLYIGLTNARPIYLNVAG